MENNSLLPSTVEREFFLANDERIRDFSRPLRFYFVRNPYAVDDPCLSNSVCVVFFDFASKQLFFRKFDSFEALKYGFSESVFLSVYLNPKQYSFLLSSFFSQDALKNSQIDRLDLEKVNINVDDDFSDHYTSHASAILDFLDKFKRKCISTSDIPAEIMRAYYFILSEVTDLLCISKVFS